VYAHYKAGKKEFNRNARLKGFKSSTVVMNESYSLAQIRPGTQPSSRNLLPITLKSGFPNPPTRRPPPHHKFLPCLPATKRISAARTAPTSALSKFSLLYLSLLYPAHSQIRCRVYDFSWNAMEQSSGGETLFFDGISVPRHGPD